MTPPAAAGPGRPSRLQFERAYKLLNRSLETFYQKRYEQAVELCAEALEKLLPAGTPPETSPEQKGELFLRVYADALPAHDAEGITGVFTFFQSRRTRFQFRRGAPLPQRDWWQFIRVQREEAEGVIHCTRQALTCLEHARRPGD